MYTPFWFAWEASSEFAFQFPTAFDTQLDVGDGDGWYIYDDWKSFVYKLHLFIHW